MQSEVCFGRLCGLASVCGMASVICLYSRIAQNHAQQQAAEAERLRIEKDHAEVSCCVFPQTTDVVLWLHLMYWRMSVSLRKMKAQF